MKGKWWEGVYMYIDICYFLDTYVVTGFYMSTQDCCCRCFVYDVAKECLRRDSKNGKVNKLEDKEEERGRGGGQGETSG